MIPFILPNLGFLSIPSGGGIGIVDFILASTIGLLDLNPLLDLFLTPLAWAMTFFLGA